MLRKASNTIKSRPKVLNKNIRHEPRARNRQNVNEQLNTCLNCSYKIKTRHVLFEGIVINYRRFEGTFCYCGLQLHDYFS